MKQKAHPTVDVVASRHRRNRWL